MPPLCPLVDRQELQARQLPCVVVPWKDSRSVSVGIIGVGMSIRGTGRSAYMSEEWPL